MLIMGTLFHQVLVAGNLFNELYNLNFQSWYRLEGLHAPG